ncbi:hypothetical protein HYFRA_00012596 [Hymenoscyphus fraxineus]|uniref:Uncharacterized protein n=1 Tax=Hymenoscyphus fraxineus TaxID=746836 RepID=A0A9N9L707_9HELO|nr:hypothetical protein HYFRA_00012596 [Hymenoscyphus fraxineus]
MKLQTLLSVACLAIGVASEQHYTAACTVNGQIDGPTTEQTCNFYRNTGEPGNETVLMSTKVPAQASNIARVEQSILEGTSLEGSAEMPVPTVGNAIYTYSSEVEVYRE